MGARSQVRINTTPNQAPFNPPTPSTPSAPSASLAKSHVLNLVAAMVLVLLVIAHSGPVAGLKCFCDPQECDTIRPEDCPGKGLIIKDPCKCCDVCAKTEGEACGGPGDFSGTCEPPLKCISKIPVSEPGICTDLLTRLKPDHCVERIAVKAGCQIVNKKCQCWSTTKQCRNEHAKWDFRNIEECQLNLKILLKDEMEFDEDFKITPNLYDYKRARRRRQLTTGKSIR